jgi:hypothetical protein
MKTLMKQGFLLAAVLLVATILVTGCFSEPEGYTPPDGMGAVLLKFNIDPARAAILPPNITMTGFSQFRVTFAPTVTAADGIKDLDFFSAPIVLLQREYDLEIIAYMLVGGNHVPAAVATETFIVGATTTTHEVTLYAYDPDAGTANGTFAWNITNSISGLTAASMEVTSISGGSAKIEEDFNLTATTWTGSEVIIEGYYYVDFVIVAGGFTRNFRHILHIYRGQTSTFSYTFDNDKLGISSSSVTVTPIYVQPTVTAPIVQNNAGPTPVTEGGNVPVSLTGAAVTLSVTNAVLFTTSDTPPEVQIEWFYGSKSLTTGASYLVSVGTGNDFTAQGKYMITVTGTTEVDEDIPYSGSPSSTEFFIVVGP